jgi:transposase
MAGPDPRTGCLECRRLRERIAELEAQLATARKHSGNSSKPPSGDIVKPPQHRPPGKKKRKRGGQPGHPQQTRPAFPPEQVDTAWDHTLDCCPDCHGPLVEDAASPPRIVQQVEVVAQPLHITEHRGLAYWCPHCQRLHYAPLPTEVTRAGLAGPRLTALVGFLKGACHCSFSTIRKFLRDVVGVTISRGQLAKLVQKVSASLAPAYAELVEALPGEGLLNVDETGHPDQRQRLWTWCFRASLYTLFRIDPSRGSDVLVAVLGQEFDGLLGCDYFSAYRKYMKTCGVAVQFCLAHLIRDVKFLVEHSLAANRRYGTLLLNHLRALFGIIHRRELYASETSFRRALTAVRNRLVDDALTKLPDTAQAGNLADRFAEHMDSYFRFITSPQIEPTNNLAEQAIRFVAIHRRLTQGTRGPRGQRWCERIWTVVTSCAQQGRSVFHFLYEAVEAFFHGRPAPSLLPDTT